MKFFHFVLQQAFGDAELLGRFCLDVACFFQGVAQRFFLDGIKQLRQRRSIRADVVRRKGAERFDGRFLY